MTIIASYPKSGSTWIRAFLFALLEDRDVDLTRLGSLCPNAADWSLLDRWTGLDAAGLAPESLLELRPDAYRLMAEASYGPRFLKMHDRFDGGPGGRPVVPTDAMTGVVYVVRHPCDVVPSLAAHLGVSLSASADIVNSSRRHDGGNQDGWSHQAPQRLGSWSQHVRSWLDAPVRRLVLRYEDLLTAPAESFTRVARFVGGSWDAGSVQRAVARCSFGALSHLEDQTGFQERSPDQERFFRRGVAGDGARVLPAALRTEIGNMHGPVMHQLGYAVDDTLFRT